MCGRGRLGVSRLLRIRGRTGARFVPAARVVAIVFCQSHVLLIVRVHAMLGGWNEAMLLAGVVFSV